MRNFYKNKVSLLTMAFCMVILSNLSAQQSIKIGAALPTPEWASEIASPASVNKSMFTYCDTLDNSFSTDSLGAFTLGTTWGYYPGSNQNDLSYAEKFTNTVTGTLSSFFIIIYKSNQVSTSGVVTFKVYGPGAAPSGTALGTKTVAYSALTPGYNEITFASPINITGNFYISMELAPIGAPQDTVAMGVWYDRSDANRPNSSFLRYGGNWIAAPTALASLKNTSYAISAVLCQNITSAPVADFNGCNSNVGATQTITFNDLSTNAPSSWSWVITPATGWAFQNSTSAVSQNPEVKFTTAGNYSVALTATNSIGSNTKTSASCITLTGINEVENNNAVSMFPNPAAGSVTLIINMPKNNMQVNVYNTLGEVVYTTSAIKSAGDKFDINLSEFNNGIYLVEVKSDNKVSTKRLVVNK